MIKKFSLKIENITPWLLTIVMVFGLLGFAGKIQAYFLDDGISQSTSFHAGTLEMTLNSRGDFSPQLMPSQTVVRNISVDKAGDLPFQYIMRVVNTSGGICGSVTLKAELNGTEEYNGDLNSFNILPVEISDSQDHWVFTAALNGDGPDLESKSCQFQFIFEAWQINMTHCGDGGFTDEENIDNVLQTGSWIPKLDSIGNRSGTEGELLEFTINAVDPNGDTLVYSVSNLPTGATFTPSTKTFSWIPSAGIYPGIHFEVSDGHYINSEDITITIDAMPSPVISNIAVKSITSTSVDITWNTDQLATSKVEYGTAISYGLSAGSSTKVTDHSISLTELIKNTLYHYRVISKNSVGKETASDNDTFNPTNPS